MVSLTHYLLQPQTGLRNAAVMHPKCVANTVMGTAYLAKLAVGYGKDVEDIRSNWVIDREFSPAITDVGRSSRIEG